MKKLTITVAFLLCITLAVPTLGQAGHYYYGGGCCYNSSNYWVPAAIIGGTILAGALIIGAMNQPPRPAPPPQPVYRPIDTRQPYAAPDPDFVRRYGASTQPARSGDWVTVPAQKVGNQYVPAHRVFVPNS